MKTKRHVPYLKLVKSLPNSHPTTGDCPKIKYELQKTGEQLSFPYLDPHTIVLANVADLGPNQFVELVSSIGPKWVVDIRITPRFDQIARSRQQAFMVFKNTRSHYIDLFGQLGLNSYNTTDANPEYWGLSLFEMIRDAVDVSSKMAGPFLFLFDNPDLLDAAKSALSSHYKNVSNGKINPKMVECGKHSIAR